MSPISSAPQRSTDRPRGLQQRKSPEQERNAKNLNEQKHITRTKFKKSLHQNRRNRPRTGSQQRKNPENFKQAQSQRVQAYWLELAWRSCKIPEGKSRKEKESCNSNLYTGRCCRQANFRTSFLVRLFQAALWAVPADWLFCNGC